VNPQEATATDRLPLEDFTIRRQARKRDEREEGATHDSLMKSIKVEIEHIHM
jgi:hypothetical protein